MPPLSDPPFTFEVSVPESFDYRDIQDLYDGSFSSPDYETVEKFWNHPSEFHRLYFLWASRRVERTIKRKDTVQRSKMIKRALKEAHREGVAWTPLLDQLATKNIWPARDQHSGALYRKHNIPTPRQQAYKLSSWVRQQPSEKLEDLFEFEASVVQHVIASQASDLDNQQISRLVESQEDVLVLIKNEHLSQQKRMEVVDHFVQRRSLYGRNRDEWSEALQEASRRGLVPPELAREWMRQKASTRGMSEVLIHDERIPKEDLMEAAQRRTNMGWLAAHPNADREVWAALLDNRGGDILDEAIHQVLDAFKQGIIDQDHQEEFIRYVLTEAIRPSKRLRHEIVSCLESPELGALALEQWDQTELRALIAQNEVLRTHPPIREVLNRSRRADIKAPLIREASPEELPDLVEQVSSRDPEAALSALESRDDLPDLPEKVFVPLLNEGGSIARRAMRLCASVSSRSPDVSKTSSRSRQ